MNLSSSTLSPLSALGRRIILGFVVTLLALASSSPVAAFNTTPTLSTLSCDNFGPLDDGQARVVSNHCFLAYGERWDEFYWNEVSYVQDVDKDGRRAETWIWERLDHNWEEIAETANGYLSVKYFHTKSLEAFDSWWDDPWYWYSGACTSNANADTTCTPTESFPQWH